MAFRSLGAVQLEIDRLKDEADGAVCGGRGRGCLGTQGQVGSQHEHEEYGQGAGELPHLHVGDGRHEAAFILLRQWLLAANGKPGFDLRCCGARLSSADADDVIARGDQSNTRLVYITQVARLQR